jgi:tetratricopeptide (TPR) repeat protein
MYFFALSQAPPPEVLGAEHPNTATSLNNLAFLLRDQCDLAAARALFERSLAIYEKTLGAAHPDTAVVLRNLASVRRAQGEAAEPLALGERALRIVIAAFGTGGVPRTPATTSR